STSSGGGWACSPGSRSSPSCSRSTSSATAFATCSTRAPPGARARSSSERSRDGAHQRAEAAALPPTGADMSLLDVEGLRIRLPTTRGLVTVVDGGDYAVEEGEGFGVPGES